MFCHREEHFVLNLLPLEHTRLKLTVYNAALTDEYWGCVTVDLHDQPLPLQVDSMTLQPMVDTDGEVLKPVVNGKHAKHSLATDDWKASDHIP